MAGRANITNSTALSLPGAFDVDRALEVLISYLENLKNNWSYFCKCVEPTKLEVNVYP